jgi:endonuclease YncB( thermonuclease family)
VFNSEAPILQRHLARVVLVLATCFAPPLVGCAVQSRPAPVEVVCARTQGFHDGDTFACSPHSGIAAKVVRVAGLDAPETGQAYWRVSRDRLRSLVPPGSSVDCYKVDTYQRDECRVRASDGSDIVETMVREGLAWHSEKYLDEQAPDEQVRYAAAQRSARAERRGLWSEPDPQPPWECRRLRKQSIRCR